MADSEVTDPAQKAVFARLSLGQNCSSGTGPNGVGTMESASY